MTVLIAMAIVATAVYVLRSCDGSFDRVIVKPDYVTIVTPRAIRMIRNFPRAQIGRIRVRDQGISIRGIQQGQLVIFGFFDEVVLFETHRWAFGLPLRLLYNPLLKTNARSA